MFWSLNCNMNEYYHKYFSVDIASDNNFVTMLREPMISSVDKNDWNWNFADLRDLVLIQPDAATGGVL